MVTTELRKMQRVLVDKKLFYVLIVANLLATVFIFFAFHKDLGGDSQTYLGLAEGIKHGEYSFWWFLPYDCPDTFRTPGYPLFLLFITSIYNSLTFVQVVQLMLYVSTLLLALSVLHNYHKGYVLKNVFLLLVLPSLQIGYTAITITPDMPSAFFIMLIVWVSDKIDKSKYWKYVVLGLLYGIVFQMKPVFLLFPIVKIFVDVLGSKYTMRWVGNVITIVVFALLILPYASWNYRHHDVFKVTPLEGGGGVMHTSYWSFKIPDYVEHRYWEGNRMPKEPFSFVKPEQILNNIKAYEREWDYIDSSCAQYLTHRDTLVRREEHKKHVEPRVNIGLGMSYNSEYTIHRERLLTRLTIKHYQDDIPYTVATRVYTAVRIWITGIQMSGWTGKSLFSKMNAVYPFLVSALIFLLSIVFIPLAYFRKKISWNETHSVVLPILYFGLIHLPFVIQARYTIPVRLLLIMLLALSIFRIFNSKKTSVSL